MESRETKELLIKVSAQVQNTVSDLDGATHSTKILCESLENLANFIEQTKLQELAPINSAELVEIAREVKKLSNVLEQVGQSFKDTELYV